MRPLGALLLAFLLAACASAIPPQTPEEPAEPSPPSEVPAGAEVSEVPSAPPAVPAVLSPEDVIRLVPDAPVNRAARSAVIRAEGNLTQAGLSPNPMLMLGADRWPIDDVGEGPLRYGIRAYQWIETAGKRSKRAAVAERQVVEARWEERIVNITIARTALGAHQDALASTRRLALREEALRTAQAWLSLTETLYEKGREREQAIPPLRARVGRLRIAVEHERAAMRRSLGDLEALLSLPSGCVKGVTGALLLPVGLPAEAGDGSPEIAKNAAAIDTERARAESADTGRYPDVRVGLGYEYQDLLDAGSLNSFGLYLEVPLPFVDRGQGEVAASVAAARRAEQLTEAERQRVATEYAMTLDVARYHAANLATWTGSVLPALERDRELVEATYEAGRSTQTEVLAARLAELEGSIAAVEEEAHLSALTLDALALLGRPPEEWLGTGPAD
jgi:cobalt-zinc-cadmium efflux system outer membrane protein